MVSGRARGLPVEVGPMIGAVPWAVVRDSANRQGTDADRYARREVMHRRPPAAAPGQAMPAGLPTTPRRTKVVRVLLFLGFVGLAAWFLRSNPTWDGIPGDLQAILEVLGGYAAGLTISWLVHRRAHESTTRRRLATIARDIIAAGALALSAYICIAFATRLDTVFTNHPERALSLVVTFIFGSRVIGH